MDTVMEGVMRFMLAAGQKPAQTPGFPDEGNIRTLRKDLLQEEFDEYLAAEANDDLRGIADALADMIYIIAGTAHAYGIPLTAVFNEVQRSNMAKLVDGILVRRDDGKVLKPPGWTPPDIESILRAHGADI